jgi:hypothetical protein
VVKKEGKERKGNGTSTQHTILDADKRNYTPVPVVSSKV